MEFFLDRVQRPEIPDSYQIIHQSRLQISWKKIYEKQSFSKILLVHLKPYMESFINYVNFREKEGV